MEKKLLLGVKMCGNCNPEIDSMTVVKRIAGLLNAEIIPYGGGASDITLTVSGCRSACVDEDYPADARIIGLSLDGHPCEDEKELSSKAAGLLKEKIKKTL
ncbi:MAG: hypothetical protein VB064_00895 [Oscillospiraceae bacterium]|nr:hypothetical protein [Oscillospiraceae bacterium]